jgi:molybdate transport system regulatory protein
MHPARYTRSQVATLLHVAPKTLYNWERDGKIAPPQRDARGWRWYTEEQLRAIRALLTPGLPVAAEPAEGGTRTDEMSKRLETFSLAFSARNCLRGTVKSIAADGVTAEVVIDLGHGQEIVAVITRGSVERLGLRVGEPAVAVIKATEVMVAR